MSPDVRLRTVWMMACAALPGSALVMATLVMLVQAVRGNHPLWPHGDVTLSEAAALRDSGEVAWLISNGADPNAPARVRRQMLAGRTLTITPLEAAVTAERAEIVSLLLMRGAAPDGDEWNRLACLARRAGAADVERVLAQWRPDQTPRCDGPPPEP